MTDPDPDLTVVVPTAGRPDGLARVLRALAAQQPVPERWDVVVVDNNPEPQVAAAVAARAGDLAMTLLHEPRPGASAARNRGVAAARGAWTALLDDDVVPARDWLIQLCNVIGDDVDGVGGRVLLDGAVRRPAWMDDSLAGFVTFLDLGPRRRPLAGDEFVLTANAAFRTELLRRMPFDPRLGPRPDAHLTNDDIDLVRRAREAGARICWAPEVVVVHDAPHDRLTVRWLASRAYQQGRSDRRMDAGTADAARLGGLRAGAWYLRDRVGHWWRERDRTSTFAAHLLAESARTVGWWRESLAAVEARRRASGSGR